MNKFFNYGAKIFQSFSNIPQKSAFMMKVRKLHPEIVSEIAHANSPQEYLIRKFDEYPELSDPPDFFKTEDDIKPYLSVLVALDQVCALEETIADSIHNRSALNFEYLEGIEMYPTYPSLTRSKMSNDSLPDFFPNMMCFVKKEKFRNISIKNFYLSSLQDTLRIAFVPYPNKGVEFWGVKENPGLFRETLNEIDTQFLKKCERAIIQSSCDILFSTEMCGSPAIDRELRKLCAPNSGKIIVSPSYHVIEDCHRYNRSRVYSLINDLPEAVYFYKFLPAQFRKEGLEQINTKEEKVFPVFHVRGIGKIGCMICSDLLREDHQELIKDLNLDFLIVQCYTKDLNEFYSVMRATANKKRFLFVGNSCQAMGHKKVPFVYPTYNYDEKDDEKDKDKLVEKVDIHMEQTSCTECSNYDCYWVLEIKVDEDLKTNYRTSRMELKYKGGNKDGENNNGAQ